jgi:hypothetical protein
VEAEIFDFVGLRKLNMIDFNRWAGRTPCSEGDVGRLGFIDFHPPSFEPVLNCYEVRLKKVLDMKSTSSFLVTDACRLSFMWEVPTGDNCAPDFRLSARCCSLTWPVSTSSNY